MKTAFIIQLAVSVIALAASIAGLAFLKSAGDDKNADAKRLKKRKRLFTALLIFALWLLAGTLISRIYIKPVGLIVEFSLFSERVSLFGISVSKTVLVMWGIIALIFLLCLIFRLFVFPKFSRDNPKGLQNCLEIAVESMEKFAGNTMGDYSSGIAPYMFSLAVMMIFSAASELFGLRAPTSDITLTLAMGIITFVLINFYGFRKKGFSGRIKGMANPTPIIFPIKILSDIAVPVSLACRLFGNMLGGMIVMDLLKTMLGGYAGGIPAVAGLYFNLFHPIIQAYIFIILSMTFINEAIE